MNATNLKGSQSIYQYVTSQIECSKQESSFVSNQIKHHCTKHNYFDEVPYKFAKGLAIELIKVIKKKRNERSEQSERSEKNERSEMERNKVNQIDKTTDVHELLKQELTNQTNSLSTYQTYTKQSQDIKIGKLLGLSTKRELQDAFRAPTAKYHILFDSFDRNLATSTDTKYSWNYQSTANLTTGGINTKYPISNLIKMKISQFQFPFYTGYVLFPEGRISVYIEEFKSQSFIYNTNRNFHFMLRAVQPAPKPFFYYECQPIGYNNGEYHFNQPITTFSSLTISLGNPGTAIVLPADRSIASITAKAVGLTTITTTIANNLQVGYYILIKDFTTATPTLDASIIAQMNNPNGIQVNSIIDAYTFTITIDTMITTVSPPFTCYFMNYRYMFMIEMTCLQEITN